MLPTDYINQCIFYNLILKALITQYEIDTAHKWRYFLHEAVLGVKHFGIYVTKQRNK